MFGATAVVVAVAVGLSPLWSGYYNFGLWAPLALAAVVLLVVVALGAPPRFSRYGLIAGGALAVLLALSVASMLWASSKENAWTDSNQLALYAVIFAIGLIAIRNRRSARVIALMLGAPALVASAVIVVRLPAATDRACSSPGGSTRRSATSTAPPDSWRWASGRGSPSPRPHPHGSLGPARSQAPRSSPGPPCSRSHARSCRRSSSHRSSALLAAPERTRRALHPRDRRRRRAGAALDARGLSIERAGSVAPARGFGSARCRACDPHGGRARGHGQAGADGDRSSDRGRTPRAPADDSGRRWSWRPSPWSPSVSRSAIRRSASSTTR